jgi:hypothetical protein
MTDYQNQHISRIQKDKETWKELQVDGKISF